MAERPIVKYGDPVLREVAEEISEISQETKVLVSEMADALKKAQGLGLAAPQVGVGKRLFLVNLSAVDITESLRVFINPEILATEGEVEMEEGCLSFPGLYLKIVRAATVTVRATDLDGQKFELDLEGLAARAVLHEFDHLEGVLFIDHLSTIARSLIRGKLKKLSKAS